MSPAAGQGPATWIRTVPGGLRLSIRVIPRTAESSVTGIDTDAAGEAYLAVRLKAPPVDGKANAELVKLLARRWRVARGALSLVTGAGARRKVVHVAGEPDALAMRIMAIENRNERRLGDG